MCGRMKKSIVLASSAIVIIVAAVLIVGFIQGGSGSFMKIDGEEVSEEEYFQIMEETRFSVSQYFLEKYSTALGTLDEWETEYEGENPVRIMMDHAVRALAYSRAVYKLAEERGYVGDDGYEALLERWRNENEEREKSLEQGQIVYGLTQFSLEQYISYELEALEQQFLNDKNNKELEISQQEREEYFRNNEWTGPDGFSEPQLDEIQSVVDAALQKERYRELIAEYEEGLKVWIDEGKLYDVTLEKIRKWYGE